MKKESYDTVSWRRCHEVTEVEKQAEDAPQDMKCHKDSEGHSYDFGFGMDWKGVIRDGRAKKFIK